MYYNSRYYVDRYGNVIEVHDDGAGGIAGAVLAILIGIFYAMQQVWLWLQSHYVLLGVFSIFAFIAWVGWVNLAFRKKIEITFRGGLQGFFGLLGIVALFNGSIAGYSRSSFEADIKRSIRGEWKQVDAAADMKITDRQISINSKESGVRMELQYAATMLGNDALSLDCYGKVYPAKKSEKPQQTSLTYWCQMNGEQLLMTETNSRNTYAFVRK